MEDIVSAAQSIFKCLQESHFKGSSVAHPNHSELIADVSNKWCTPNDQELYFQSENQSMETSLAYEVASKENKELRRRYQKLLSQLSVKELIPKTIQELSKQTLIFLDADGRHTSRSKRLESMQTELQSIHELVGKAKQISCDCTLQLNNLRTDCSLLLSKFNCLSSKHDQTCEELSQTNTKLQSTSQELCNQICEVSKLEGGMRVAASTEQTLKDNNKFLTGQIAQLQHELSLERSLRYSLDKNTSESACAAVCDPEDLIHKWLLNYETITKSQEDMIIHLRQKCQELENTARDHASGNLSVPLPPVTATTEVIIDRSFLARATNNFQNNPNEERSRKRSHSSDPGQCLQKLTKDIIVCGKCMQKPYGIMIRCKECAIEYHAHCARDITKALNSLKSGLGSGIPGKGDFECEQCYRKHAGISV